MSDEQSATIDGYAVSLDSDRSVWVGEKDNSLLVYFKNNANESPEIAIRLNRDAALALIVLLQRAMENDSTKALVALSSFSDGLVWQLLSATDGRKNPVKGAP